MNLIHESEKRYVFIATVFSILVWLAVLVGTVGVALLVVPLILLFQLIMHSGLISYLKGNGVKLTSAQFPKLYQQVADCCAILHIQEIPQVYIINGNGVFNALATHFLAKNYVVLMSSVVESLQDNPAAINFYLGHELGHIKRKHVSKHFWLLPFRILPVAGLAYSRACEYTCDLHGLACCQQNVEHAQQALAVLAAGGAQWKDINLAAFREQVAHTKEFWMSFHELTTTHPWLSKRCLLLQATHDNQKIKFPRKNFLAYLPALCIPNLMSNKFLNFIIVPYLIILGVSVHSAHHRYMSARQQKLAALTYQYNADYGQQNFDGSPAN